MLDLNSSGRLSFDESPRKILGIICKNQQKTRGICQNENDTGKI